MLQSARTPNDVTFRPPDCPLEGSEYLTLFYGHSDRDKIFQDMREMASDHQLFSF